MYQKIHENQQPKMQPFYWILTFEMLTFAMLLGLALIAGPFVLLSLWPSGWMWLTLLALPVGVLIFILSFGSLKERIWRNRHTNSYTIYEDRIEYIIWDWKTKEADQGSLPIRDIQEIYYGRYVQQYSYAFRETAMTEKAPMLDLLPVLHLIYGNSSLERKMLTIPFTEVMGANRWLEVLGSPHIPVWLSSIVIHDPKDDAVIDILTQDKDKTSAVFDGNIERQFRPYLKKLIEIEDHREPTDEELAQLEDEINHIENMKLEKKKKSALRNIGLLAWLVFPIQYGLSLWIVNIANNGDTDPHGLFYPFAMLLLTSIMFFLLVKRMRWLQMLYFQVASFIVAVIINLNSPEDEANPIYQMTASLLVGVIFFTALIWIPYFVIKYLRRGRDAKDHNPSHTEANMGQDQPRIYR